MFETGSIYSVLRPMFYSTKILGYSPFVLNNERDLKHCLISILDSLWSFFVMISLGGIAFGSLNSRSNNHTLITKVTDFLHSYLCVISMCSGMLFALIFKREIEGVVRDISILDGELRILNFNFDIREKYRKSKLYLTITTAGLWIYIVGLLILDVVVYTKNSDWISVGQVIAYGGPMFTTFVELQFCSIVLVLKERFSWLNQKIAKLNRAPRGKIFTNHKKIVPYNFYVKTSSKDVGNEKGATLAILQRISIQHHDLCTITKKLNKAYSFQLLLIIIQAFMTFIAISFYLARVSFSEKEPLTFGSRVYYANMLVLYISCVVVLIIICSKTAMEAQKSGILLHKIASLNFFIDVRELDLGVACFSLQLLHHNVKFTACRLFIIDESLLYSIVGAATTFLVIVLQFEIGVNSTTEPDSQYSNSTIK